MTLTQHDRDALQAILHGVDQLFRDSEAKWGVGRLIRLVSDPVRESFKRGFDRWSAAIDSSDLQAVRELAPKMRQALAYMDQEAVSLGHQPLSPETWEARLGDGRTLVVVKTAAEASAVSKTAEGRALVVWTMDELAMVLPKLETLHAVKRMFPGATALRLVQNDEGAAQRWVKDDEWQHMHEEDAQALDGMYRDGAAA